MAIVRATAIAGCEPAHKTPPQNARSEINPSLVKACLLRLGERSKRGHEMALLLARGLCDSNVLWLTFAVSNAAATSAVTPTTRSNMSREISRRPKRVVRVGLAAYRRLPLYPYNQTSYRASACLKCAMCGRLRFGKSFLHGFAALVVAAMCSAF
jgi:hypothetical protein